MDGTILVADDDQTIRTVLTQALTRAGARVHATSSLTTLLRWVEEGRGDAVISDVMMPDGNGLEMLPRIEELRPGLPVIVISAQNSIMTAVRAEEANAFDYLPKPFDLPELMKRTARALEVRAPQSVAIELPNRETLPLIGKTAAMQEVYRLVARLLNSEVPLLITGDSGTGKSLLARAMHDLSDRRGAGFQRVGASDLVDLETADRLFARAKGGTLVFDEIADFSANAQALALRMVETGGDDAPRFIATSQHDLNAALASGALRQDLYYRLEGAQISVPPLNARMDDILLLAAHFLTREGGNLTLSAPAAELARAHPWPGNVRQLENVLRRLALSAQGPEITEEELRGALGEGTRAPRAVPQSREEDTLGAAVNWHVQRYFDLHGDMLPPDGLYARILREVELPLLEIALDATAGNQAKCADLLGINRNTLRKKLTELDIRVTRRRKMM